MRQPHYIGKPCAAIRSVLEMAAVLLLMLPLTATAQDYPFIRRDANVLHYDTAAVPMQTFFQKFRQVTTTGKGTISIMHIGGSHVQAGTFPHQVRTRFANAYPTLVGGRGLIFPYSAAAKCNNPHDYKVHCVEKVELTRNVFRQPERPMGLCGISVTAHDTVTRIQMLSTDRTIDYGVSRVVVLGYSPDGVVPGLSYQGRQLPPSYVDPATHRYIFNLRTTVDSFDIILPCHKGQRFTLTGVCLDSRHPGITYHAIGVNGAAVPDYFKCVLKDDLHLIHPDLVLFGIGINDAHGADFDSAAFRRNYLRLCDSIRSVNPRCAFVFITNNDCYRKTGKTYKVNTNGLQVREVCYRLAEATGGAVWDQFEIMGGLKSMELWQKAGLAQRDKVHFTHSGYLLLGDLLFEALQRELSRPVAVHAAPQGSRATSDLPRGLRRKPHHAASTNDNHKVENSTPEHDEAANDEVEIRRVKTTANPPKKPSAASNRRISTAKPAGTNSSTSKNKPDSDRFPYLSY